MVCNPRKRGGVDEEEVFLEIDEYEFDLDVELRDEVFDGFDEVFPSHLVIKPKK